jgi:hypothetical protein
VKEEGKTMKKWKWQEITIWAIAEIILNFAGYDNLADYTEFISSQSPTSAICCRANFAIASRKV